MAGDDEVVFRQSFVKVSCRCYIVAEDWLMSVCGVEEEMLG